MKLRRLLAAAVVASGAVGAAPSEASPEAASTCSVAGPANSASVERVVLPRGAPSLAMRITTSSALSPSDPSLLGGRKSWHLATEIALLRATDGAVVAYRMLQKGSAPRRLAASAGGRDVRADLLGPGLPFKHSGGYVPDYLPAGSYLLVAWGSDGDPALPNPGWSAEVTFGTATPCLPSRVRASVFDLDQSAFHGGTQLSAVGPGVGSGTAATLAVTKSWVVGMVDAQTQLAGRVRVKVTTPHRKVTTVENALRPFAGRHGRYLLQADWTGAVPLVLVAGVAFDAP